MYLELKINKGIVFRKEINMGAQIWPKHPYFIFAYLCVLNIAVFALSVIMYIYLLKGAANLAMSIITLVIPITGFGFGFYNITKHLREIRAHNKEKEVVT